MISYRKITALTAATAVAASLAFAAPSLAQKRDRGYSDGGNRISWTQLVSKIEGQGYSIRELDMKRNGWKAEVVRDGNRYELRLDRQGNVLRKKWDD